eukprot:jgi/Galph1/2377/GphlegSOOS_G1071.1
MSSNSEKSKSLGGLTPGSKEEKAALAELRHERLLYCLGGLIGLYVNVEVRGGSIFRGIFHGASRDLGICLKYAYIIGEQGKTSNNIVETLVIEPKDLVQVVIRDVDFLGQEQKKYSNHAFNSFHTDAEIASRRGKNSGSRQLQPFEEFVSLDTETTDGVTFGELDAASVSEWDQFTLNREKFGVNSTFSEDLYTTKLDRSTPDFEDRAKKAEELANQIRKTATSNIHLKEERGQELEKDYDEEVLYGAVLRKQEGIVKTSLEGITVGSQTQSANNTMESYSHPSSSMRALENGESREPKFYSSSSSAAKIRQRTTEEFRRFKEEMDKKVNATLLSSKIGENDIEDNKNQNPVDANSKFQLPENMKHSTTGTKEKPASSRLNVYAAEFCPGQSFTVGTQQRNNSPQDGSAAMVQEMASLTTSDDKVDYGASKGEYSTVLNTAEQGQSQDANTGTSNAGYTASGYTHGPYTSQGLYEGSPSFIPYNFPVGFNGKPAYIQPVIPPNIPPTGPMGRVMGTSFGFPTNNYPIPNAPPTANLPYFYPVGQQFYYGSPYQGMINPVHYVPNFPVPTMNSPLVGAFQGRSPQEDWHGLGGDGSPYLRSPSMYPQQVRATQRAAMGVPVSPKQPSEQTYAENGGNTDN